MGKIGATIKNEPTDTQVVLSTYAARATLAVAAAMAAPETECELELLREDMIKLHIERTWERS